MNNKGADQTARMRRLICAFVVRKRHKTHFRMAWPILLFIDFFIDGIDSTNFNLHSFKSYCVCDFKNKAKSNNLQKNDFFKIFQNIFEMSGSTTKLSLCTTKTHISLGILPVWSVFSVHLKNVWAFSYPKAYSAGFHQTGRMGHADLRLYWVHGSFCGLSCSGFSCFSSYTRGPDTEKRESLWLVTCRYTEIKMSPYHSNTLVNKQIHVDGQNEWMNGEWTNEWTNERIRAKTVFSY